MNIRTIQTEEDSLAVFPIMKELRSHLDESKFLELLMSAKTSGYELQGFYQGEKCLALLGYRVLYDFVHGKHLYIDDLVVDSAFRNQGVGAQLLEHAKAVAAEYGCQRLRLCTGVENENGRRFYEKNGLELKAVVFKSRVGD